MHFNEQQNAKILPINETDSTVFTIHSFEKNVHSEIKLKSKDNDDGNEWISKLKMATQTGDSIPVETIATSKPAEDCSHAGKPQMYECLICFESSTNRIVVTTMCGHIFCKTCIQRWIEIKPSCPVCKSAAYKDKLIRLYGSGGSDLNVDSNVESTENRNNTEITISNERLNPVSYDQINRRLTLNPSSALSTFLKSLFREIITTLVTEICAIFFKLFLIGIVLMVVFIFLIIFIWIYFGFITISFFIVTSMLMFKLFIRNTP